MLIPFCDLNQDTTERQAIAAVEINFKKNIITLFMSKKFQFEARVISIAISNWFQNRDISIRFIIDTKAHAIEYHSDTKHLKNLDHVHVHFEEPIKLDRNTMDLFLMFIRQYQDKNALPARRKIQEFVFC